MDHHNHEGYIYKQGIPADAHNYTELAKNSRCNDFYHSSATTPPDLALPADYSVHTTHGVGLYLRSALKSTWILGQTNGYNTTSATTARGPVSIENYWYLFEASPHEGEEGVRHLKDLIQEKLVEEYHSSRTAFNTTYAVTLVYTLFVFLWVFASVRTDLVNESRHNRNSKFLMVIY